MGRNPKKTSSTVRRKGAIRVPQPNLSERQKRELTQVRDELDERAMTGTSDGPGNQLQSLHMRTRRPGGRDAGSLHL